MARHTCTASVLLCILFLTQRCSRSEDKRLLASDPNYIHQLEIDVQDLKAKMYETTSKYSALSSNVANLISQNAKMTMNISKLTTENVNMKTNISQLTSKNAEITTNISKLERENSDLVSKNAALLSKNADLTSKFGELRNMLLAVNISYKSLEARIHETDVGSVYVRWGRTSCPDTAELIHTGYVGGSWPEHYAAAVNYLCMPKNPKWRALPGTVSAAFVYGSQYEDNFRSSLRIDDYEAPCSVCRTNKSSILMIPATTECLDGWTLEYEGDLAAGSINQKAASEYVCLDKAAERTPGMGIDSAGHQGKSFFPVGSKCGTLPCPPYVEGGALSCVVCSK